jgi:hypothetical protein
LQKSDPTADNGKATVHLSASNGAVRAGGNGQNGRFSALGKDGKVAASIQVQDDGAWVSAGGNGWPGHIVAYNSKGVGSIEMNADTGRIQLFNANGMRTVAIDAEASDIRLYNADCAEEFDLASPHWVEPGTVMVLDDDGRLRESAHDYDRKVAGVVSGAGGYRPGIVLERRPTGSERAVLALLGKVYCKVDASYAPIAVGDLLTTSATPGHAMKATDAGRAFGSVIGKALRPLETGRGLIPLLIALQ